MNEMLDGARQTGRTTAIIRKGIAAMLAGEDVLFVAPTTMAARAMRKRAIRILRKDDISYKMNILRSYKSENGKIWIGAGSATFRSIRCPGEIGERFKSCNTFYDHTVGERKAMRHETSDVQAPMGGLFALARKTDPETSHEAARMAEIGATTATHRQICLKAVNALPGQTSAEIARKAGLERHEAARRLSDLYNAGLVDRRRPRKCTVKHTKMFTWWPI